MGPVGRFFNNDNHVRTLIAFLVIGAGMLALTVVSWVALANAAPEDKGETTRLVFASIVPLVGTWVGAVLAFYFSSANLRTGSDTTLAAVRAAGGLSPASLVTEVWTPLRAMLTTPVADEAAADKLVLKVLYDDMQSFEKSRMPILTKPGGVALYVVHESDIDKYAATLTPPTATSALGAATLKDLREAPGFAALLSFATVPEIATVADARTALSAVAGAKDVFVTDDGTPKGAVKGWLTNSDLARSL